MLAEGTVAPPFTLRDQYGRDVSLDDYKGRSLIFWWYPKASTPG